MCSTSVGGSAVTWENSAPRSCHCNERNLAPRWGVVGPHPTYARPMADPAGPGIDHEWLVERSTGEAGRFHERPLPHPLRPTVWIHRVTQPAIVLGSTQQHSIVDVARAERAGFEICRRRSGGGLVVVDPDTSRWIDVLVPNGHELWSDDVGKAFDWLGETWRRSLVELGLADVSVHRGPMVDPDHGRIVCFAGLGPGEISVEGRKVVGLSQRRTRDGARFQGLIVTAWDPAPLRRFVTPSAVPTELDERLDKLAVGTPLDLDSAVAVFIDELPGSAAMPGG